MIKRFLLCLMLLLPLCVLHASGRCTGHFINPVTDICWHCLFPLSIGDVHVVGAHLPDTKNPSSPLQVCTMKSGVRVGLAIGYWEPFATVDVTRTPYCLVNLGGIQLNITHSLEYGGAESPGSGTRGAFYQVHWYKYPLIAWLNIITSVGCMQHGDYDIGYVSELDPAWHDDELSALLSPEEFLFANRIAQTACALDAISAARGAARNRLFWCLGAQGSAYPMDGDVPSRFAPLADATLLAERMAYRLHRLGLIEDSSGKNGAVCHEHYRPIMPKNRYRYELMNPRPDSRSCHPFGRSVTGWQTGMLKPDDHGNWGYLIWRKRNCVFL